MTSNRKTLTPGDLYVYDVDNRLPKSIYLFIGYHENYRGTKVYVCVGDGQIYSDVANFEVTKII